MNKALLLSSTITCQHIDYTAMLRFFYNNTQLTSTAITSSPISHSVDSINHTSTSSTSELQLRSDTVTKPISHGLNFTNDFNCSITDLSTIRTADHCYTCVSYAVKTQIWRIILRFSLANSLTHVVSLTLFLDVTPCYRQSRN